MEGSNELIKRNSEKVEGYILNVKANYEINGLTKAIEVIESLPPEIKAHDKIRKLEAKYEKEQEADNKFFEDISEIRSYEVFKDWLAAGSTMIGEMKLRYQTKNKIGVYATRAINKNELLSYISDEFILTPMRAKAKLVENEVITNDKLDDIEHCYIPIFLLLEAQNPESFWKPYIDIFPKDASHFPIFYSENEMRLLKGLLCLRNIQERKVEIRNEYNRIAQEIPIIGKLGERMFGHYRILVTSRYITTTIKSERTNALIPFLDMINFDAKSQIDWNYENKAEGLIVKAKEFIRCGTQLTKQCEIESNIEYLLTYGSVLEDNVNDELEFKIGLDRSDPLYRDKLHYLEPFREFILYFDRTKRFCYRKLSILLSYLRLKVFNGPLNEVKKLKLSFLPREEERGIINLGELISVENEIAALNKLLEIIKDKEERYPTTLQQDELRVTADANLLSDNQRNCMILGMGEKKVLKYLTEFADSALGPVEVLQRGRRTVLKENTDNELYKVYIDHILTRFLGRLV